MPSSSQAYQAGKNARAAVNRTAAGVKYGYKSATGAIKPNKFVNTPAQSKNAAVKAGAAAGKVVNVAKKISSTKVGKVAMGVAAGAAVAGGIAAIRARAKRRRQGNM